MKTNSAVKVNMGVFVETGEPVVTLALGKETIGLDPTSARGIAEYLVAMAQKIEAITADGHRVQTLTPN